eukprot:TRINITY_DN4272_c0_g1_i1.p1 TRINITY_DN4272_c0_g1~~TRINITY_DN4272_c0_g1_i1.p1  ORF type:complete len:652 (-),score=141.16 TRINITY_DN4272_c0_g1_i1:45-2000(-)
MSLMDPPSGEGSADLRRNIGGSASGNDCLNAGKGNVVAEPWDPRRQALVDALSGAGLARHADEIIEYTGVEHVGQLGLLDDDLPNCELRPAQRRQLASLVGNIRSAWLHDRDVGDGKAVLKALGADGLELHAERIVEELGLRSFADVVVLQGSDVAGLDLKTIQHGLLQDFVRRWQRPPSMRRLERRLARWEAPFATGSFDAADPSSRRFSDPGIGGGIRSEDNSPTCVGRPGSQMITLTGIFAEAGLARHSAEIIRAFGLEQTEHLGLLEDHDVKSFELRPAPRRQLLALVGVVRSVVPKRCVFGDAQDVLDALRAEDLGADAARIVDELGLNSFGDVAILQEIDVTRLHLRPVQHRLLLDFVRWHKATALGILQGARYTPSALEAPAPPVLAPIVDVTVAKVPEPVVQEEPPPVVREEPVVQEETKVTDPVVEDPVVPKPVETPREKTLPEIIDSLTTPDSEFSRHLDALSNMPPGSKPLHVAQYFWDKQVLLTPKQAKQVFDKMLPNLTAFGFPGLSVRGELVFMTHSFCLEPFAVWEGDDGAGGHIWRSMSWSGNKPSASSSYYKVVDGARVGLKLVGREYQEDESISAKWPTEDVSQLGAVLRKRGEDVRNNMLEAACFPSFNVPNNTWLQLAAKVSQRPSGAKLS